MPTRALPDGGVSNRFTTGRLLALAGAVLTAVAALLPWVTVSLLGRTGSATGLDMLDVHGLFNGVATLLLAVVVAVLVLAGTWRPSTQAVALVLGGLVALVGLVYVVSPSTVFGSGFGGQVAVELSDVGIGVFGTILGGVLIAVGAGVDYVS